MTMHLLSRAALRKLTPPIRGASTLPTTPAARQQSTAAPLAYAEPSAGRRRHIFPRAHGPKRKPLDDSHPFKHSTLQAMTFMFAPAGSPAFSSVQELLEHHPFCTHQHLVDKLTQFHSDPERWLIIRNAIVAQSWPEVRETMRQGFMDSEWPTFVLERSVRLTSTLSEVSDALVILQQRAASIKTERAKRCMSVLAKKALDDLPGIHLAGRLVDTISRLIDGRLNDRHSADMVLFTAQLLTRHDDDRARSSALRLLELVESNEGLQQELAATLLGLRSKRAPVELGIAPRKNLSGGLFLTVELVDHLLTLSRPRDHRQALRVAMLTAGRRRKYNAVKDYFFSIAEPSQSDLYAFVLALSRAPHKREAWASLPDLRESNRTLELVLDMLARDPSVPLARTFAMLMVRMPDTTEEMLAASQGLTGRFAENVKAYAMAITGLVQRGCPEYAEKVWHVMRARGVQPNTIALTAYVSCLFKQGKRRSALEAIKQWCVDGVQYPSQPAPTTLLDIDNLQPHTSDETRLVRLQADLPLAHVLFYGLAETPTVLSIWQALHATLSVVPDAPILAVLLRSSTTNKESALTPHLATAIFRKMLLSQHPELAECSAAEVLRGHSWAARSEIGMRNLERWWRGLFTKDQLGEWDVPVKMTFTPALFEEYVNVLLHLQWQGSGFFATKNESLEEMVTALVWMRRLDLTPKRRMLAAVCLEMNEALPPLGDGDEDSNAGVAQDWLYDHEVPTDEEMQEAWERKHASQ